MDEISSYQHKYTLTNPASSLHVNPTGQTKFFGHFQCHNNTLSTSMEHQNGVTLPHNPCRPYLCGSYTEMSISSNGISSASQGLSFEPSSHNFAEHLSNYSKASSNLTSPSAALKYSSLMENESIYTPHMDISYRSPSGSQVRDASKENNCLINYAINSTNSSTNHTVFDMTRPISDTPSVGYYSGITQGYSNCSVPNFGRKFGSNKHETSDFFHDSTPESGFRNPFQNPEISDRKFHDKIRNSHIAGDQSQLYASKINEYDVLFNSQNCLLFPNEVNESLGMNHFIANGINERMFAVKRKPYRSFSSELNSPNLPLSDDHDVDFEFPLEAGSGDVGSDNFTSTVQPEASASVDHYGDGNESCYLKNNIEFCAAGNNISNNNNSRNSECCDPFILIPKVERDGFMKTVANSESYGEDFHSEPDFEHDCFKTEDGKLDCQIRSRYVSTPTRISFLSEIPAGVTENPTQQWPYCQQVMDTNYPSHLNGKLPIMDNPEVIFRNSAHFLDVMDFPYSGNFRNYDSDIGNFSNMNTKNKDFSHGEKKQISPTSETHKDGFLATSHILAYLSNDNPDFDIPEERPTTKTGHNHKYYLPLMNDDYPMQVPEGTSNGQSISVSDVKQRSREFTEAEDEHGFSHLKRKDFADSGLVSNNDISSTTARPSVDNLENLHRDRKNANNSESDLETSCAVPSFHEGSKNDDNDEESGLQALLRLIQQDKSAESLESEVVKSALDHFMKHRPRAASFPTATEIFDNTYRTLSRHLKSHDQGVKDLDTSGYVDGEKARKRRRGPRVSSEDVTTTTSTPSPNTPSSSSSPSLASAAAAQPFSVAPYLAGITATSSSSSSMSNDGCGNSSVSSSSKPEKRRPSVLPPCRVCCSKASGLHYGVVTCEACNGFFRRSLKRGAIYLCSKEKKCDVRGKKRGECSHCRYQKCISVGMSKSAVKTGRYSDKTRLAYAIETETHNKANQLANGFPDLNPMTSELINIDELHADRTTSCNAEFEMFEMHYKEIRQRSSQKMSAECMVNHFCKSGATEVPSAHVPEYAIENGLLKIRAVILEKWLRQYLRLARNLPGFKFLPISDQSKLVRAAWQEVWMLESCRCYSQEMKAKTTPTTNPRASKEMEAIFGKECANLTYRLSAQMEQMKVTPDELVLIQMSCLTDPQMCRLDAIAQVRSLNWLVMRCLRLEVERSHPDHPNAFSEISAVLNDLRAARHQLVVHGNDYVSRLSLGNDTLLLREILTSPSTRRQDEIDNGGF